MSRTRSQVAVAVLLLVVVVAGTTAAIAGAWSASGVIVIAIGGSGVLMSMVGKPARVFGLTELLLQQLPDRAWRAVYLIMGCCIIGLGVVGLTHGGR